MKQEVPEVVVREALSHTQTTTLTEALLVMLGVKLKRCANETCQKEFLFQERIVRARKSTKKPRSDAQYCSDICARRATQRAYVRRKRAKTRTTP